MNIDWNAKGYQKDFAFVPKYGEAVLDLIDAAPGHWRWTWAAATAG